MPHLPPECSASWDTDHCCWCHILDIHIDIVSYHVIRLYLPNHTITLMRGSDCPTLAVKERFMPGAMFAAIMAAHWKRAVPRRKDLPGTTLSFPGRVSMMSAAASLCNRRSRHLPGNPLMQGYAWRINPLRSPHPSSGIRALISKPRLPETTQPVPLHPPDHCLLFHNSPDCMSEGLK